MRASRRRSGAIAAAAALLLSVLAFAVPSTSGAYVAQITNTSDTAGAATRFTCTQAFTGSAASSNAYFEYRLAGTAATATDSGSDANTGSFQAGGAHPTGTADTTTACPNDSGSYYAPDGSSNWVQTAKAVGTSPSAFSLSIWFFTSRAGGYLLGLNSSQASNGGSYDRHVYVDTTGHLTFGTYSSGTQTITSPSPVNDGKWHQAVATLSPSTGMALWIDGVKVSSNAAYTTAENNTGYWRVGFGPLGGWPNAPTDANSYFQGGLRFAAAYRSVLSDGDIAAQYANGKPGP